MKSEIAKKLLDVNRRFYQQFADQFDATRQRLQPGVSRVMEMIDNEARVLDLGCGNGHFFRELIDKGYRGEFTGVDFSEGLLASAKKTSGARASFFARDLATDDWDAGLPAPFDFVVAFAVFHHLPPIYYPSILEKIRGLLAPHPPDFVRHPLPGGEGKTPVPRPPSFIFSNWQFLNSDHWRGRIQPWEKVNITEGDVDPDDYLLDWRRGGVGYRYIHHFTEDELNSLARATGFKIVEQFYSDGKEGNLALYQVWEVDQNAP